MGSFTPCFGASLKRYDSPMVSLTFCQRAFAALLLVFGLAVAGANATSQPGAHASIERVEPTVLDGQLAVDIDIDLTLSETMQRALSRGVPLYFVIELQIEQPRWWWFDKTVVNAGLERRLSFNTLTRTWRVSTGDLAIPAADYEEALRLLSQVRNWPVVLTDRFEPNRQYQGRARIRLDTEQLARPLQMDSVNRNSWSLSSPWKPFDFAIRREPGVAR
jgi:hypothetical protein